MNDYIRPTGMCRKTTCPYCGVGCGVDAITTDKGLIAVSGSNDHPANKGKLCIKGSSLDTSLVPDNRLLFPQINGTRSTWDNALEHTARAFREAIENHGPESIAFYLSGQLLTEDYYIANKLMKGFLGSANVDTNSRLCMASAVAGYKRAFGADAVPCSYEDLECCDLLILIGSNAAWTHPVLYQRIAAAKEQRPDMRIVLIDPRKTASCNIADLHLPLAHGSDSFLFNGLLQYLSLQNRINRQFVSRHTSGLPDALSVSSELLPENVSKICDLPRDDLMTFYQWFADTEKTISFYSQGINQSASGTDKCNAIINCHLATGRIGKPGAGPFSITGQPNAMGGREVGGLANQLAAQMDFTEDNIDRVSRFWQAHHMAQKPGLKAADLFQAMAEGKIKAVWIMATNPMVSIPDTTLVEKALTTCKFVAVSDFVESNDTNAFANVLFPATGWSEKDGTVTNSERTISRQRQLLPAAGEARPDWMIVRDFAHHLGFKELFPYQSARDIFVEHAALSGFENEGQRAFDISALSQLSNEEYENMEPVQWPVNLQYPQGCKRLFTDGRFFTEDGKARIIPVNAAFPEAETTQKLPWLLNTGRIRDQWHTMSRTGASIRLLQHISGPFAALHPSTAKKLDINPGDLINIENHQGDLLLPASIDDTVNKNEVFTPIHWNRQFASNAVISKLISRRVDPLSGQPESKYEPVSLQKRKPEFWSQCLTRQKIPAQQLAAWDYWEMRPIENGYSYRMTLLADSRLDVQQWLKQLLADINENDVIEFNDELNGDYRLLSTAGGKSKFLFFKTPKVHLLPDPSWVTSALGIGADKPWELLHGQSLAGTSQGRIICTCHEVGENQIREAIQAGCQSVQALGARNRCGTNCGSCIPELKKLLDTSNDSALASTQTLVVLPEMDSDTDTGSGSSEEVKKIACQDK